MDLTALTLDELIAYQNEQRDIARARQALGDEATAEQVQEGLDAFAAYQEAKDEQARRDTEASGRETLAGLALDDEPEPVEETVEAAVEEPEPEPVTEPEPEAVVAAAVTERPTDGRSARERLAGRRPENVGLSANFEDVVSITAAANTDFPAGQQMTIAEVGQAAHDKLESLPRPDGDGKREDLVTYPIAKFDIDYPEDLRIDTRAMSTEQIHSVFEHASDPSRLPEGMVASAGWCAPSQIMYDLPNNEVVDGILDVPEVAVTRGGFKHTTGLDWATLYSGVGFLQTESQAISGTSKTCYEVPCPSFTDERLDAIGICIKVPILLETGYPEMVGNVTARSLVAHQYKVNASVASRIVTAAGSARDFSVDLGSSMADSLSGINLVAVQLRQKYRIGTNAPITIILPVFAQEIFREDLSLRNGRGTPEAVSDAEIAAHFAVRNVDVQYIWGWQELTTTDVAWPTSVDFVAYPTGTFVKGTSNVINLSAVYDAASLAVNIYTGLFFEQGLLVAKMNFEAVRGTISATSQHGKMGALSI